MEVVACPLIRHPAAKVNVAPASAAYLTGQSMVVDGGQMISRGPAWPSRLASAAVTAATIIGFRR